MLLLDGAEGTKKITGQAAADGLLGLSGGAKKSELISISNGSYVDFDISGWHRLFSMKMTKTSFTNLPTSNMNIMVHVQRTWGSGGFESHGFQILNTIHNFAIQSIYDCSNNQQIKKIRFYITKKEDKIQNELDCDIFYNPEGPDNSVYVTLENCWSRRNHEIHFPDSEELVPNEINTNLTTGWFYEHTFKSNSWMDGPDTWPLS